MTNVQLLNRKELAEILRTSPESISNQIYKGNEGITLPVSLKIGSKRLWQLPTVIEWLKDLERAQLEITEGHFKNLATNKITHRPQNPKGIRLIEKPTTTV
jgi:hypothetical protein